MNPATVFNPSWQWCNLRCRLVEAVVQHGTTVHGYEDTTEFREMIREEAIKLKQKLVLENEKKALVDELNNLNEEKK